MGERYRICELITELAPAGAERCVYELATRLDRRVFDVQVAALRGGRVAEMLAAAGVKVTVLGMRGKWDLPRARRLAGLLKRERIDLLHTHLFHADVAGRLLARRCGVRRLVHSVHVAEKRWRPWHFGWSRWMAGRCDRIVCVSQAVREFHGRRTGLSAEHYTVIVNGIDVAAYGHDGEARRRLRGQWGVADGDVVFAFVGRLDYQKGLDTLMAAMEPVMGRRDDVYLVIAGQGPMRASAERFAARAGRRVRLAGFVEDVRALYSAADALVMPSRWEGLPLTAVEAMAAGLPVAGTRVEGLSEVVLDGLTGVLVEAEDAPALAEAMLHLAGDAELRSRLGRSGRDRARESFSIEKNVAAHERLYLEVLGAGQSTDFADCADRAHPQ